LYNVVNKYKCKILKLILFIIIIINLIALTIILNNTPQYASQLDELLIQENPTIVNNVKAENILNRIA
jgi:hypothetical protein